MTDVKVVAPMNMGKGIKWDQNAKQYYVAVDPKMLHIDDNGNIQVSLSKENGNQLSWKPDGLYYGVVADEEIRNLYVSNFGNDNNRGTREAPLQTINEAVRRLKDTPAHYNILLHENHEFEWVDNVSLSYASVSFVVYGDISENEYPWALQSNAFYRGYTAKNYPRPIINVRSRIRNNSARRQSFSARVINLVGLSFRVFNRIESGDSSAYSGYFPGIFNANDEILFHGCTLEVVTNSVHLTGAGGVS